MRNMVALTVLHFICFTVLSVSCTQKRALPERSYSSLITALCTEDDGTIRKVCLQNISTGRLIEEIYSRIEMDRLAKQEEKEAFRLDSDIIGTNSLPEKRGKESNQGFYSNWLAKQQNKEPYHPDSDVIGTNSLPEKRFYSEW